jgi:adenosylcobinamide-GDP ribazoletransferase
MHGRHRNLRLISSLSITLGFGLFTGIVGVISIVASLLVAIAIVGISNKCFEGLTGDVFGAGNELARLGSLLAIVGARKWM